MTKITTFIIIVKTITKINQGYRIIIVKRDTKKYAQSSQISKRIPFIVKSTTERSVENLLIILPD
jgi:hypothetical protein